MTGYNKDRQLNSVSLSVSIDKVSSKWVALSPTGQESKVDIDKNDTSEGDCVQGGIERGGQGGQTRA